MEDDHLLIRAVHRAARAGASTVSREIQVQEDAAEVAVERWTHARLAGKQILAPLGWARVVGRNAATAILARRSTTANLSAAGEQGADQQATWEPLGVSSLVVPLEQIRPFLTDRMVRVVDLLCYRRLSMHEASRLAGMDRTNLRRCFQRALGRLRRVLAAPSAA